MAGHPNLESARLKLNRSREHIEALKAEDAEWFKAHRNPFIIRLDGDLNHTDRILGSVRSIDNPDPIFSTIVGDVIYNLHSALDHIAWQVFKHGSTPSLKPGKEKQVQFPICLTLSEFGPELKKRIPGILPAQEAIVRRYQPYTRGALAPDHPFARLQRRSIEDKHRNIHLTYWCASKAGFEVTHRPIGCEVREIVPLVDLHSPLDVNTPLFYVTVSGNRHLCRGMDVQSKVTLGIAFEDGTWVHNTISEMERLATDLLAEIDGVL